MHIPSLERLGAALVLGSLAATAAQATTYRIVDLGSKYFATAINDRGELAANSDDDHAAVFRHEHWRLLPDGGATSLALAINAGGDVAGQAGPDSGFWPRGGDFTPLTLPPDATGDAAPAGISDHQVIVGDYFTALGQRCYRWSAAEGAVDLGVMGHGDECFASAINDAGQIAGYADIEPGGVAHSFRYTNGAFQDLGTLDGNDTYATGINRQGHVVGWTSSFTSFLWKEGTMVDLRAGTAYSSVNVRSINDSDELAGSATDTLGQPHAVRFADGQLIDLETEVDVLRDWQLRKAIAVNNRGEIVGWGFRTGDQRVHYFMLVPDKQP
jgi:probable HAF family extracellular repeat protein